MSTTVSLVICIVIVAAVLFWIIRSTRKQSRHLDDLHITSSGEKKE